MYNSSNSCAYWWDPCVFQGSYVINTLEYAWYHRERRAHWKTLGEHCEHISSIHMSFQTYLSSSWIQNIIYIEIDQFFKNLDDITFETKPSYYQEYDNRIIQHFLAQANVSYWRGRTSTWPLKLSRYTFHSLHHALTMPQNPEHDVGLSVQSAGHSCDVLMCLMCYYSST